MLNDQITNLTNKNKELEKLKANTVPLQTSINRQQSLISKQQFSQNNEMSASLISDPNTLFSTICDMQQERKALKAKLTKAKLNLFIDESSYLNKFIETNIKSKNDLNENEANNKATLKDSIIKIHDNYKVKTIF